MVRLPNVDLSHSITANIAGNEPQGCTLGSHALGKPKQQRWTTGVAQAVAATLSGGAALVSILSYTSTAGIAVPVLGPIGAVAGAFIGYTAGPSIARRSRATRSRRPGSRR